MNKNARTSNVIKNAIGGVGGQIFTSILTFVCRTFFIQLLGSEYLGVNGLFSNILSMLSLAELGIGPAIVFSMYKPIACNDELHVAKLMNFYKLAYRLIAVVVAIIGIALVPFLDYLIKGSAGVDNLELIFILILSNTVISYLYAYKGSMLNADQRGYIVVIIRNIFAVVQNIAQIVILMITKNFILYLIVQIITTFAGNFIQAIYVDKKYPFLLKYKAEKIDKAERKDIMKRVRSMMMHKIGGYVLNSTDNLIISKFIGIAIVGLYSNYLMIINLVKTYISHITRAISASVGNMIASESDEKSHAVFKATMMVYFWIYGFCFVAFWVLFQPFITLWIGDSFLIDRLTLLVVLMNFYFTGLQDCVNTFTNATGLFWETRFKPVIECIVNLGVSIILAIKIGLVGIFIGTIISYFAVFWINPVVIYKKHFNASVINYFVRFLVYTATAIVAALLTEAVSNIIVLSAPILDFIVSVLCCAVIPNLMFILIFHRTSEYKYIYAMGINILKKIKRRD